MHLLPQNLSRHDEMIFAIASLQKSILVKKDELARAKAARALLPSSDALDNYISDVVSAITQLETSLKTLSDPKWKPT